MNIHDMSCVRRLQREVTVTFTYKTSHSQGDPTFCYNTPGIWKLFIYIILLCILTITGLSHFIIKDLCCPPVILPGLITAAVGHMTLIAS